VSCQVGKVRIIVFEKTSHELGSASVGEHELALYLESHHRAPWRPRLCRLNLHPWRRLLE
jgi:hypothetical protein